ncbi:MAG: hypothetical protein JRI33_07570 [Deltaproteobacteria bacterium]|nr:hypothetical protein [Deltaproteobacteria bacterium]
MKNNNLVTTIEIKDRQGRVVDTKEVVTYAGLLNQATQDNLKKVYTELIQLPSEANRMTAICMAEVETDKGIFRDYGDANPQNVSSMIIPHIIRMAVTRAKARAFRDAVNIGVVALEELGAEFMNSVVDNAARQKPANMKTGAGDSPTNPKEQGRSQSAAERQRRSRNSRRNDLPAETDVDLMTDNQRRFLFRLLAERGLSGDDAHDWLVEKLGVETLKEAAKTDASYLIEGILSGEVEVEEGATA